jgi:hypothetical protein
VLALDINPDGKLILRSLDVPPRIYLDHWALLAFARDPALGARLRSLIVEKKGTLVVSWLNVGEFSKMPATSRHRTADDVEALLESILPRLYFLDSDAVEVEARERAHAPAPHQDEKLARLVVEALRPLSVQPITVRGMFHYPLDRTEDLLQRLKDAFLRKVAEIRGEVEQEAAATAAAGLKPPPSLKRQMPPRDRPLPGQGPASFVWRELAASVVRETSRNLKPNDAVDVYHAVVPAAYCDFVVLDGRWHAEVSAVRTRCEGAGAGLRMARTFSGRKGGLDAFLAALAAFPASNLAGA